MINSNNLLKLQAIFEDIVSETKDAEFKNIDPPLAKMSHLLDDLAQMQSLIISIRAELIEKVFSIRPNLPEEITNQIKIGANNIILFNRRKADADRRKLHSYVADDRRTGLANRRHGV
jgi:hypothetical protein